MDITSAIMDPELGRSAFTVERLTYTRTTEGTTSRSITHQAMGCVHPGTPEMIQLLPEEERHEEFIAIVVAVITAGFAYLGVYSSNRKQAALVAYRLEKLEEKVGKHNNLVERMYKLESRLEALEGKKG